MNEVMIRFIVLSLLALVAFMAYLLHEAWGEIDDMREEIEELEDECAELDATARKYKHTCQHYEMIAAASRRHAS